jgi:tetratricopeptide (TPR) repeat protein
VQTQQDIQEAKEIKGSALFYRADCYFQLLQSFCKPYDEATAMDLPGLPLRLSHNVQITENRAGLKQCYDQVLADLEASYSLVPEEVQTKNRPTKAAVEALRARVYLAMGKYDKAAEYANEALNIHNELLNYAEIQENPVSSYVFPRFNREVIYHSQLINFSFMRRLFIDTALINAYHEDDLRGYFYFVDAGNGMKNFKNSYTGDYRLFSGLATDELLLIKAECLARDNQPQQALQVLNSLLETRWKAGRYIPYVENDPEEVLKIVLMERRKELVFRAQRWSDLRRLNMEPSHAITLSRTVDNNTYTLPPNDVRYTFLIPQTEIQLSGIEQNPR